MQPSDKRISKFISFILRHKPETINLALDENGWADTRELLDKSNAHNVPITLEQLENIVLNNDKKRFIFSPDQSRIRANQGHSVEVDLQLEQAEPPQELYHGTAVQNIDSIKLNGIIKGQRHHVHLSADRETAEQVGSRYGKAIVLTVNAKKMHEEGALFYLSENGVWLVDVVSPKYINI